MADPNDVLKRLKGFAPPAAGDVSDFAIIGPASVQSGVPGTIKTPGTRVQPRRPEFEPIRGGMSILDVLDTIGRPLDATQEAGLSLLHALIPEDVQVPEQAQRSKQSRQVLKSLLPGGGKTDIGDAVRILSNINRSRPLVQTIGTDIGTSIIPGGAVKGTVRLVGEAAGALGKIAKGGKTVQTTVKAAPAQSHAVTTLLNALDDAVLERKKLAPERTRELGKRMAKGLAGFEESTAQAGGVTDEALRRLKGNLKGQLPGPGDLPTQPRDVLTQDDIFDLRDIVLDASTKEGRVDGFEVLNNMDSLDAILAGQAPQPAQIARLQRIFGEELTKRIVQSPGVWENVVDALNIPRTVMSSFDLSAPLRQGAVLGAGNPREFGRAIPAMLGAAFSDKKARQINEAVFNNVHFGLAQEAGVFFDFSALGKGTTRLSQREEAFMSRIAVKIPGIRQSQRAYTTFLNKLRHDVFYKYSDDWLAAGKGEDEFKELAKWINIASGRGPLPKSLATQAPTFNALFFSPRFMTSRFMIPVEAFRAANPTNTLSPEMRRMIARDIAAFVGTNLSFLTMAKFSGLADVETDPRSSDFGRVKFGNTRVDFWAGMQPLARYTAQLALSERKVQSTGEIVDQNQVDTMLRFLRTKLSPIGSAAVDTGAGETLVGDPTERSASGFFKLLLNRSAPLVLQDIAEAVTLDSSLNGWASLPGAVPQFTRAPTGQKAGVIGAGAVSFLGGGANTFVSFEEVRDQVARERTGLTEYQQVTDPAVRFEIDNDPRIQARLEEAQKRSRAETPQEQLSQGMQQFTRRAGELEVDMKAKLDAGRSGKTLRESIQDFKTNRFQAFNAAVPPTAREFMASRKTVTNDVVGVFRDRYWSVSPPENLQTGELDFNAMDAQREQVLAEAEQAGIPREHVAMRDPGRFADPIVKAAVEGYEKDIETLRPYFAVPEKVITDPALLSMYRTQPQSEWTPKLKALAKRVTQQRELLRRRSRTIDGLLMKWGFVETSIRERGR